MTLCGSCVIQLSTKMGRYPQGIPPHHLVKIGLDSYFFLRQIINQIIAPNGNMKYANCLPR